VAIDDKSQFCERAAQGIEKANTAALSLKVQVRDETAQTISVTPGTYTIGEVKTGMYTYAQAQVVQYQTNDVCLNTLTITATAASGSITIDTVSETDAKGRFDALFSDGGRLSGFFDAPICNAAGPPTTVCEP
jgi:hypothetical protein